MIRGLKTIPYEERLNELSMFSLEKKKTEGRYDRTFQILERLSFRGGAGSVLNHPRQQDTQHGVKLHEARFWLNIRKNFLTV